MPLPVNGFVPAGKKMKKIFKMDETKEIYSNQFILKYQQVLLTKLNIKLLLIVTECYHCEKRFLTFNITFLF